MKRVCYSPQFCFNDFDFLCCDSSTWIQFNVEKAPSRQATYAFHLKSWGPRLQAPGCLEAWHVGTSTLGRKVLSNDSMQQGTPQSALGRSALLAIFDSEMLRNWSSKEIYWLCLVWCVIIPLNPPYWAKHQESSSLKAMNKVILVKKKERLTWTSSCFRWGFGISLQPYFAVSYIRFCNMSSH